MNNINTSGSTPVAPDNTPSRTGIGLKNLIGNVSIALVATLGATSASGCSEKTGGKGSSPIVETAPVVATFAIDYKANNVGGMIVGLTVDITDDQSTNLPGNQILDVEVQYTEGGLNKKSNVGLRKDGPEVVIPPFTPDAGTTPTLSIKDPANGSTLIGPLPIQANGTTQTGNGQIVVKN